MTELHDTIGDYTSFVEGLNAGLARSGIQRDELAMCDHLCFRVDTLERYQTVLTQLGRTARLLGESLVSGRLIATFEFADPLNVGDWSIPCLELPQPKEGSLYPSGLEHAEFVTVTSLAQFQARHPDLPFDPKGMDKIINPELGLKHDGISVKFHEQPLGAVVRIEQRLAAQNSL